MKPFLPCFRGLWCALLGGVVLLCQVPPSFAQVTLLFEGFEGNFPLDNGWVVRNLNADGPPAYWDDVDFSFGSAGTHSGNWKGYCAGIGYGGTPEKPTYQNLMTASMSRSLDLQGFSSATLSFWFETPSIQSCCDHCSVYLGGTAVWSINAPVTAWTQITLDLSGYAGQSVELRFEFASDASVVAEGWYLDDILVTATPAAPPNDDLANAQGLTASAGTLSGSNVNATKQSGEPNHAGNAGGHSIWYSWTADQDNATAIFDTIGSSFDTLLAVYLTGAVNDLTLVTQNDDLSTTVRQSRVQFTAQLGRVYYIAVDGYDGAVGNVLLNWSSSYPPPNVQCPSPIVVACQGPSGTLVNFGVAVSAACPGAVPVVCTPASGSLFGVGDTVVSCVATDACGGMGQCRFTIKVEDNVPPLLQCPSNTVVLQCGSSSATGWSSLVTVIDNCDPNPVVTCTPPLNGSFPLGVNSVTCLATDAGGNSSQCSFSVQMVDTLPPQIQAPVSLTASCTGADGAVVNFAVSATDLCDAHPLLACAPPSGSVFPIGFTSVTCVATDNSSNRNAAAFSVQVAGACDAGCVAISCPSIIQVDLGPQPKSRVEFAVNATNTCSGQPYPASCTPPSGSEFSPGTNTVTCVATAGGASMACAFQVVVNDVSPPVVRVPPSILTTSRVTNALGQAGAYVNFQANAADNAGVVLSYNPPPGSFFPVGTTTVSCTARDPSGNQTVTSFNVEVFQPAGVDWGADNWGFENQFLTGWTANGDAFGYQPVPGDFITVKRISQLQQQMRTNIGGDYWANLYYSVGHKGQNWVCTAYQPDAGPGGSLDDQFSEQPTGMLLSKSFVMEKKFITFLIGGNQDDAHLRVEWLVEVLNPGPDTIAINGINYAVAAHKTGHGRQLMRREWWEVPNFYHGNQARIRIVDDSPAGHLNVDDFRFQDISPSDETVTVGGQIYPATVPFDGYIYDWDSPVWGFVDLHTHPMSYLGFGGKMMHGKPDGGPQSPNDIASALSDCKTNHGGWGLDNPQGNYWRQILMLAEDDNGPDPHREGWHQDEWMQFRNWPVFRSVAHQQMWYEWIERAYDGGLRVMVALCVNSRLLAVLGKGEPALPVDDQAVADLQIAELKNFVARHSDFMQIAYNPFQLRDIVRNNKLAIIIGTELDDTGNFARNPNVNINADDLSKRLVRAEIGRLYTNGVRYIFPIHLVNNKFGGTAIAGLLLNIANKYLNHEGFLVQEALPEDHIKFWLKNLDFTAYIDPNLPPELANFILAAGAVFGAPLVPLMIPWIAVTVESLPIVPPGAGGGVGPALAPLALLGAASMLPPLLTVLAVDQGEVVQAIIPLPGNYPKYPMEDKATNGVRNALGLTDLGRFAVNEMMSRGMMIDVDHMSQNGLSNAFYMATNVPGGYPLNSGHNGFRELGLEQQPENLRSLAQLTNLVQLGGLMGVGWENGDFGDVTSFISDPQFSISRIPNDCAGTSKTFGQSYPYALEKLHGANVGFGTDIDGIIAVPGPRFGPQSAFALGTNLVNRGAQIRAQANGVLYEPKYGRALTTAAFRGPAVDTSVSAGARPNAALGYVYSLDQADFYAALNLFYWLKDNGVAGWDPANPNPQTGEAACNFIATRLSDNYPTKYGDFDLSGGAKAHIANYALGLLAGKYNWPIGDDWTPDKTATMRIGQAVYGYKVSNAGPPDETKWGKVSYARFVQHGVVWDDYQKIFGTNVPMKRCQTGSKEWDINFEGVAHYGLLPDFLQDLHNVGLEPQDMSVLFRSAEHFARMWTKCLDASFTFTPRLKAIMKFVGTGGLQFSFTDDPDLSLEEADDLAHPKWQPASVQQSLSDGITRTVILAPSGHTKFYRLRGP